VKIVFVADLHLNASTYGGDEDREGLTFRSKDHIQSFEWCVDTTINEIHPDCMVILGDIYDNHSPPNNVREFFGAQLRRLSDEGIEVHVLVGNHDACKLHHALQDMMGAAIPNVHIYYTPSQVVLPDGSVLFIFPQSEPVERQEVEMRDYLIEHIKQWRAKAAAAKQMGHATFFCGHFGLFGALRSDGNNNTDQASIRVEDLESLGVDYAFLGDFHSHQWVNTRPGLIAAYTGSLERTNFADLATPKGFVYYNSEPVNEYANTGFPNLRFVENPHCREMYLIKGTLEMIREGVENVKRHCDEAVVKIDFKGEEAEYRAFAAVEEGFKDALEREGKAKLVICEKHMLDSAQQVRAEALKQEIVKIGDVQSSDIDEIVVNAIEASIADENECKALLRLHEEVAAEVWARRAK